MEENYKKMVENYIQAYNEMDVQGMLMDLDKEVVFENIAGNEVNVRTEGKEAFKKQAEVAITYFRQRNQKVQSWKVEKEKVIVGIEYQGVLGMDFPNGMKSGEVLQMKGISEFYFENGKIKTIKDYS